MSERSTVNTVVRQNSAGDVYVAFERGSGGQSQGLKGQRSTTWVGLLGHEWVFQHKIGSLRVLPPGRLTADKCLPEQVRGQLAGQRVASVACGAWFTAVATADGKVYTWGHGTFGIVTCIPLFVPTFHRYLPRMRVPWLAGKRNLAQRV